MSDILLLVSYILHEPLGKTMVDSCLALWNIVHLFLGAITANDFLLDAPHFRFEFVTMLEDISVNG